MCSPSLPILHILTTRRRSRSLQSTAPSPVLVVDRRRSLLRVSFDNAVCSFVRSTTLPPTLRFCTRPCTEGLAPCTTFLCSVFSHARYSTSFLQRHSFNISLAAPEAISRKKQALSEQSSLEFWGGIEGRLGLSTQVVATMAPETSCTLLGFPASQPLTCKSESSQLQPLPKMRPVPLRRT